MNTTGSGPAESPFLQRAADSAVMSILYRPGCNPVCHLAPETDQYFNDLHLDQIVAAIERLRPTANVPLLFRAPLRNVADVEYRQAVMRDFEIPPVRRAMEGLSAGVQLASARRVLAQDAQHPAERALGFLDSATTYCDTVAALAEGLSRLDLDATALVAFNTFLQDYVRSPSFSALTARAVALTASIRTISYDLLIRDASVTVTSPQNAQEYAPIIANAFDRFRRGAGKTYLATFPRNQRLGWLETEILDRVVRLNPVPFDDLLRFERDHHDYNDATIERVGQEAQFYLGYLAFMDKLRKSGISFCYPDVSPSPVGINAADAVDVALASRLLSSTAALVANSFALEQHERIIVVTGPNNGGKTTFARMIGQLHYIAALGLPVPARKARLLLFDHLFTHFERRETVTSLRGKLQDELVRIRSTLEQATQRSLVIMNEAFSSTALRDARLLNEFVLSQFATRDLLAVVVTFLDELSSFGETTVSYVARIDPHDPARRLFIVDRRPADGLAYAIAIAEKYQLTYQSLRLRIGSNAS